jgi:DNA replication protein DnaC
VTGDPTPLTQNIKKDPEAVGEIISRVRLKAPVYSFAEQEKKAEIKYAPHPKHCGVSKKYQDCTFDTYKGNDNLVKALKEIGEESVVLSGKTGCGKTHLAVAMMRVYKVSVLGATFITAPELLLKIRTAFSPNATETEEGIIRHYSDVELLVIDDLGAEKTSEYSITTLYLIIDRRNRELKKTIITTNLTLQEVEETLGARMASRLADMKIIKINMPDYRKNRS